MTAIQPIRRSRHLASFLLTAVVIVGPASVHARDVNIAENLPMLMFTSEGKAYTIERNQDPNNALTGSFAKTSRNCPPFCIHTMTVLPGVVTVGELELLEFIKNKVEKRIGLLIDARAPSFYEKGTIPGSINVPFTVFDAAVADPRLMGALEGFGVRRGRTVNYSDQFHRSADALGESRRAYELDFSQAKELLLFCNGPWCDQSPRAIRALANLGYPVNKLYYYRGGMQMWLLLGFNVIVP